MKTSLCILLLALILIQGCSEKKKFYYDSSNIKSEQTWVDGEKNGECIYYYESGGVEIISEYKNDKRNGPSKFYFPNGKIKSEGDYKDGKENGHFKFYNEDGMLTGEGDFKNGKQDGKVVEYYFNGKKFRVTEFKDGKANGEQLIYYDSGELKARTHCKNNEQSIFVEEYDKYGNKINDTVQAVIDGPSIGKVGDYYRLVISMSHTIKRDSAVVYLAKIDKDGFLMDKSFLMNSTDIMSQAKNELTSYGFLPQKPSKKKIEGVVLLVKRGYSKGYPFAKEVKIVESKGKKGQWIEKEKEMLLGNGSN